MAAISFASPLRGGTIRERKSIYLFAVDVKDGEKAQSCFCPAQGKMGAICQWAGVSCLLSPAPAAASKERSTSFTVEAVAHPSRPGEWIGINQLKYKDYVEFFLRSNVLQDCVKVGSDDRVVRFASAKKSGIDFSINDTDIGIQVRTLLMVLYDDKALAQLRDDPKKRKPEEQTLDKWFGSTPPPKKTKASEPPKSLSNTYKRMVVILCFAYDSPLLDPKAEHFPRELVANAGAESAELWQLNLSIDSKAVSFKKLVRL